MTNMYENRLSYYSFFFLVFCSCLLIEIEVKKFLTNSRKICKNPTQPGILSQNEILEREKDRKRYVYLSLFEFYIYIRKAGGGNSFYLPNFTKRRIESFILLTEAT